MADLLLYAMHRHGKPATAAELADIANGLAMDACWPGPLCKRSPKQVAAVLRGMASCNRVEEQGSTRDKGNERALWVPVGGFRTDAVMPERPHEPSLASTHPIAAMTRQQQLAVFNIQDMFLVEFKQQGKEVRQLLEQHESRLLALTERTRAQLYAVGLAE